MSIVETVYLQKAGQFFNVSLNCRRIVPIEMSVQMESMFKQYLAWYNLERAKYGTNTAVLMQVGKFFEIYDRLNLTTNSTQTNIREIADLCSLNLSEARDPHDDNLLKLCGGFPEQSLPKFESQLVDAGYTVVVVIQVKNGKEKVEERIIDHISSPGIFDDRYNSVSRIQTAYDACLVGLLLEPNDKTSLCVGIAAVESQTGQTWSTELVMPFLQGQPNIDAIEPFFMVHPPSEVVAWWDGPEADAPTASQLRTWFRLGRETVLHIRTGPIKRPDVAAMRSAYSMQTSLQPHVVLGLERFPQAYRCLSTTLDFIREHLPSLLKSLRMNRHWIPENRVRLGNAALEQLNIISNNSECLLHWFKKTFTACGSRALRERLATPISDIGELRLRFARIDLLRGSVATPTLEKHLRSVYDLSRLHRKLSLGTLSVLEAQHLLSSYSSISELVRNFQNTPCTISNQEKVQTWLQTQADPWDLERMKLSAAIEIERFHPWKRNLHTNLDNLEDAWAACIADAKQFAASFAEPVQVIQGENSPIEFSITRRRFEKIQTKEMRFHPFSSKATAGLLESPASLQLQKRAAEIKRKWDEEQNEVWFRSLETWAQACNSLLDSRPISEFITAWIANLDVEFALARCATEYNLTTPEFQTTATSSCEITGLRHLIIERISSSTYVKHDVALGPPQAESTGPGAAANGLLIYGTNASGKSSLMKAVGIAVLSAQCGIPVAASSLKLSPYTAIFTRILSNDNLWASLSSFAVEMTEFRGILKYADARSLILGDELCSGTETRSATAIFSAGVQVLARRGAQFLFATHLHEITELPEIRSLAGVKFAHLGVEYNPTKRSIEYRRTLEAGPGEAMYGLEVCYGLDMDAEFLELANLNREKTSRYNSAVKITKCQICGSLNGLETHHIKYQSTAQNGFVDGGQGTHHASNLAVLCSYCHDQHHAGRIGISGWVDTSAGPVLKWALIQPTVIVAAAGAKGPAAAPAAQGPPEEIGNALRRLIASKKKEKEMIVELGKLSGEVVSVGQLRSWKRWLESGKN
jgi:DNA mismatch repair protein MutS